MKCKSDAIILELICSPSLTEVKFQFFHKHPCALSVVAAVLGTHFVHFLEHVTCHYRDNTCAFTAHFFLELNLFSLTPYFVIYKVLLEFPWLRFLIRLSVSLIVKFLKPRFSIRMEALSCSRFKNWGLECFIIWDFLKIVFDKSIQVVVIFFRVATLFFREWK